MKCESAKHEREKCGLVGSSLINVAIICAILCHYHLSQFCILRNYDMILNYLRFRALYSRRHHLDRLFVIDVCIGKLNYHSIMYTGPSARCAGAESDIADFLICSAKELSPLRTVSLLENS